MTETQEKAAQAAGEAMQLDYMKDYWNDYKDGVLTITLRDSGKAKVLEAHRQGLGVNLGVWTTHVWVDESPRIKD